MKIKLLEFVSGPAETDTKVKINPGNVTIFVGPNNSGKSQSLKEIDEWLNGENPTMKVLSKIDLDLPEYEKILEWLLALEATTQEKENVVNLYRPSIFDEKPETLRLKLSADLRGQYETWERTGDDVAFSTIRKHTLKWATIRIDGKKRFLLTSRKPLGDLQEPPSSHLVRLFRDQSKREKWRKLSEQAFPKMHVALDHTAPLLRVRMSTRPPKREEETGLDSAAVEFHGQATPIEDTGDGVHAFTGIGSVLMAYSWKFLLIDDPEAYLHPPAARKLGSAITKMTNENDAQVFVSTHSSHFLRGCLDASDRVVIIRLTFDSYSKKATTHCLPPEVTTQLAKRPHLRSTGVLDAMFHKAVVITEGITDRIFYEEMNNMLLASRNGHSESHFICPHSRDNIGEVAAPLVSIGIPCAVIADIDFLWDGGKKWNELLKAMGITGDIRDTINRIANSLRIELRKQSITREELQRTGIWTLEEDMKSRFRSLLDLLAENGVFCVPNGVLESWFSELDITGKNKSDWVMNCLEKTQSLEPYQYVTEDDRPTVWDFMSQIIHWLKTGQIIHITESPRFRLPIYESENIEMKSTLDPPRLITHIVKFLNTKGGSIFIGLGDSSEVIGLNPTLRRFKLTSSSELAPYIVQSIKQNIGEEFLPYISIFLHQVKDEEVCEIHVMQIPRGAPRSISE